MVASAAPEYGKGFQCFSGRFAEGESYDESKYARIVAAEYGCEYHDVVPTARDFIESMPKLMYHMDEPAAGLPEAEIPRFATAVSVIRGRGAGVLLVDHNVALVLEVCERIHVLDQGKTLAEGTPQEIRAHLGVAAAYLGESADAEEIE